jgi:hypothetical protein
MAKQSKIPRRQDIALRKTRNRYFLIPLSALIIKFLVILRIQGFDWFAAGGNDIVKGLTVLLDKNFRPAHIWYGADGENYLRGLVALARDGFLSKESNLSYWPAGYPLLMWPLLLILKGSFFFGLAFLQSLIYAFGCAFFVDELIRTRSAKFALPVALFLTFNPTISLNTIAIGYESPSVAFILIAVAAMMKNFRLSKTKALSVELLFASISFLFAAFMQPRLVVVAFSCLIIWSLAKYRVKIVAIFLATSLSIIAVAPAVLIFRNLQANGFAAISTNLGNTMNIGAGPNSTGGYSNQATGVSCPKVIGNDAVQDSARIRCVLKWYLKNPSKALVLSWYKSIYFWSPWFGPLANGTMARNPWRVNHPLAETIKTDSGFSMVYGTGGKLLSWAWMLFNLVFMFYGFVILWRVGNLERVLSLVALATIIVNWLSSVATIGDHRFRIPSMGMSLFLQAVGFTALFLHKKRRFPGSSIPVEWPGLHWKARRQPDNLPS